MACTWHHKLRLPISFYLVLIRNQRIWKPKIYSLVGIFNLPVRIHESRKWRFHFCIWNQNGRTHWITNRKRFWIIGRLMNSMTKSICLVMVEVTKRQWRCLWLNALWNRNLKNLRASTDGTNFSLISNKNQKSRFPRSCSYSNEMRVFSFLSN